MLDITMTVKSALRLILTTIISVFVFAPGLIIAHPVPHVLFLDFECPPVNPISPADVHFLTNSGTEITGFGYELANGSRVPDPFFTSTTTAGIPLDLSKAGYYRSSVEYAPSTGLITCNYASTASFPPFQVFYLPAKAEGGSVSYTTPKSVRIKLMFG